MALPFHHLAWQTSDDDHGRVTLEAMASRRRDDPRTAAAVEAELQQVLDWAHREFGPDPGPLDEGHALDHDLQRHDEADGWHTVTLTLAASPAFHAAFIERFGDPQADDD